MVVKSVREQFKRASSLIILWVFVALFFGVLYYLLPGQLINSRTGEAVTNVWDAVYFSFVTISTIGYGDLLAIGFIRVLTAIEGLFGWVLFGLIVYRIVSVKQDVILKEIHNLSNEQYLSRVRNSLFVSNTNIVRFVKDSHAKRITKDAMAYELGVISTTLRSNIDDARRLLCRNKSSITADIQEEEMFLIVKIINMCIANLITSLKILPLHSFDKEPILQDNLIRIVEAGKGIYNYCNIRSESKRIDELRELYSMLEEYSKKY